MYELFYGLSENPFRVTPDPRFLYLGRHHKEALAQLVYGVKENKGFILITGEVGAGKTTLIHSFLERLNGNGHIKTAFLFNPKLDVTDFIQYILKDLGVNIRGGTKGDYLRTLHGFLLDAYANDKKVVLIVDEAQGLKPELLEEIRLLSNLETSKAKLLQIILVGQPELNRTLQDPGFRQLKQRVNLRYHLPSLSEKETKEYIARRLRVGGASRNIFTPEAVKEVYRKSRGIPRLINILCDNALLTGYALDQKTVDVKPIREAAKDLRLGRTLPTAWIWILGGIVTAGIAFWALWQISGSLVPVYKNFTETVQGMRETFRSNLNELSKFVQYWLS